MKPNFHFPVANNLSGFVTHIWEISGAQRVRETILPKGVVEIIFNLGDRAMATLPCGVVISAPACFVQGVQSQSITVAYPGHQHLFGMGIRPDKVQAYLGMLPTEAKDGIIDLTLIQPAFHSLWYQLKEAASFAERVERVETFFPDLKDTTCMRSQALCSLFAADNLDHFGSLSSLAQEVCYSTRQLNRKVHSLFGMSAEELITYKRFLHAVNLLHTSAQPLTQIAYDAHFYDQAHFCRTFKSYTGMTARQYQKQKTQVPFHLFEQVK